MSSGVKIPTYRLKAQSPLQKPGPFLRIGACPPPTEIHLNSASKCQTPDQDELEEEAPQNMPKELSTTRRVRFSQSSDVVSYDFYPSTYINQGQDSIRMGKIGTLMQLTEKNLEIFDQEIHISVDSFVTMKPCGTPTETPLFQHGRSLLPVTDCQLLCSGRWPSKLKIKENFFLLVLLKQAD